MCLIGIPIRRQKNSMSDTLQDFEKPEEQKDLFFDPKTAPSTSKAKDACKEFITHFIAAEEHHAPRTRQRKSKDAEILEQQLSAILGNLVVGAVRKKPTPIAVTQSKSVLGRKNSHPVLNDKLPEVLKVLHKANLLTHTLGSHPRGKQSTIEAAFEGITIINRYGLTRNDFRHREREPIVLRARKTAEEKQKKKPGKELPLPETEDAQRMREEVMRLNDYIAEQKIEYFGNRDDIDDERRSMHRVFNNGRLYEGGRLYGGFWQSLSGDKEGHPDEREDIEINGEPVIGLDYGQIGVRILYSFEGKQLEMEDAYVLPGWENSREGIKKLLNAMINDPTSQPKAIKKLFGDRQGLKVPELTQEAVSSICEHHAAIRGHFAGTSTGRLFYEESNHLMRLLMELIDMNIPALPVHDCLYVRMSDASTVRELMRVRFIEYFKVDIHVR